MIPNKYIWKTYNISNFENLKTMEEKLKDIISDIESVLAKAEEFDSEVGLYEHSVSIRKTMQKVHQKVDHIRRYAIQVRKDKNAKPVQTQLAKKKAYKKKRICPDPKAATGAECPYLENKNECLDNSGDCICF